MRKCENNEPVLLDLFLQISGFISAIHFFSIRDNSVVENYVDCEWSQTYILRKDTLDIPEDSDVIIGYLFSVSGNLKKSILINR